MFNGFDKLLAQTLPSELSYEFWPADDKRSRKLLIVLHGRGDSGEGFHWLPESLGIDSFNYLFINAPDTYGPGFSWYDLPPRQAPGIARSRQLLVKLIDQLQTTECGLNPSEIFLFGFSQGCLMAIDVALRYPKLLGGVVGASGYVYFLEEYPQALSAVARSQHLLITHGFEDEMLAIEPTRAQITALKKLGVHIDWREYHKPHTIDPAAEIPDIKAFFERMLDLA